MLQILMSTFSTSATWLFRRSLAQKLSILFTCILSVTGNAQSFKWAKQIGGSSDDYGFSNTVDNSGNVYTTGTFNLIVDFDPGAGTFNMNSAAGSMFISKLDAAGNFVWAKQFAGSGGRPLSVTSDDSGNLYITGYFRGSVDFDPGPGTFLLTETAGTDDVFILKLDSNGDFIWAKRIGGAFEEEATSIAVDVSGNVYATGLFNATVDFDPGAGVFNLASTLYADIFVLKLDASGNFVWARSVDGTYNSMGNSIGVDASGNVYTTGMFGGTADFDPGAGTFNLIAPGASVTQSDAFILKLDASGNFVWAVNFGDTGNEVGYSLAVNPSGDVYTMGIFQTTVDFDPGAGIANLTSSNSRNIFISKLNASGNFVWAKSIRGTGNQVPYSIKLDPSDNLYMTGTFSVTADLDPGAAVANLTADAFGGNDIFISKWDVGGNYVWAKSVGGSLDDEARSIAVDPSGDVYVSGFFTGLADFDPGAGVFNLSGSFQDVFILKLGIASAASISITTQPSNATACVGTSATFNTDATGTTNIIYQWQFATIATGPFANIVNGSNYSGALTKTLSVNTAGNFGAGFYRCKIDGDLAVTVFTANASLTINSLPTAPITTGASGCSGTAINLSASGGSNGQYRWYTLSSGGVPIAGQTNSTFLTPLLLATTTYYVSINTGGTCESVRTSVTATIGFCNQPPVIISSSISTSVGGSVVVDLVSLISDPDNNLDISTLSITSPPVSGAIATIQPDHSLLLNYSGLSFVGTDQFTVKVCDALASCTQHQFSVEVDGQISIFNAVSANGDGSNDIFYIQYIDVLPSTRNNKVTIFNRWGDIVFEVENYDNVNKVFRGLNKSGNELPTGIYFYTLDFKNVSETKTGFISLKR